MLKNVITIDREKYLDIKGDHGAEVALKSLLRDLSLRPNIIKDYGDGTFSASSWAFDLCYSYELNGKKKRQVKNPVQFVSKNRDAAASMMLDALLNPSDCVASRLMSETAENIQAYFEVRAAPIWYQKAKGKPPQRIEYLPMEELESCSDLPVRKPSRGVPFCSLLAGGKKMKLEY